jgi:hypothetical protein
MNAHPKFVMAQPRHNAGGGKVSPAELAQFLARLADMYRDPRTGNARLSAALLDLADQLAQPKGSLKRSSQSKSSQAPDKQASMPWLRGLDLEAVRRFITDDTKSKTQLIELASERFSIPQSKLVRLPHSGCPRRNSFSTAA